MSRLLRRQFCTSPGIPEQNPTATPSLVRRPLGPLPLPHRSVPDPAGQDLDVVTLAHSHLVRGEWPRLDALASGLTPFRVKHVLLRVRRDPVLSLEFFDWAHLLNPGLITMENHAIILHILTKDGRFRSAESILRRMLIPVFKGSSLDIFDALLHSYRLCDSSPRVFDSLFKTYAHLKKFRDATDTFRRMRDYGFLPTVKSCNAFLSSLLSLDRGDIVLTLYREMSRCRISPNAYTLNMVMRALCNSGRIEHALKLFDEMEKKGFGPMVSTFNTLIDGYCKKGLLVAAMTLKSEMDSKGLHPNVYTYNTLIHGFCKEGKLQNANKVFNEMKAANVSPNTVTYNTLISGYSRINNSEMGFRLHEEMVRDGIEVNILTYNALILGLSNEGKTKKAAYLLKELDKQDLVPTASTFSALIIGQCKRQNSERALHIYKVMKKSGFQLNADTFNLLVYTFCKNQDFEGAVELLREMLQRSMAPPDTLFVELLGGLGRSGKTHLASEIFSEFSGHKLIPEKFLKDLSSTERLEGG
ncbi:hypothetical protein Taro_055793 [Colocasia esculenta]|uniref:Pentatricopeptide repeat-containing protein n=1 Tax=Colocasia esculenta TaxID=4460 RepID=A0A843XTY4_COLES|nr:hypothetical protein [Colocasia esculenta]